MIYWTNFNWARYSSRKLPEASIRNPMSATKSHPGSDLGRFSGAKRSMNEMTDLFSCHHLANKKPMIMIMVPFKNVLRSTIITDSLESWIFADLNNNIGLKKIMKINGNFIGNFLFIFFYFIFIWNANSKGVELKNYLTWNTLSLLLILC